MEQDSILKDIEW